MNKRRHLTILPLLCLLIIQSGLVVTHPLAAVNLSAQPSLEMVLNKYIIAAGGEKAWAQISALKFEGEIIYEYPERKPARSSARVEIYSNAPDKWRFILNGASGRQQMGYDGSQGWLQNQDRIVHSPRQKRSKMAFLFNAQAPLSLAHFYPELTYESQTLVNERRVFVVKSNTPEKEKELLYFDAHNGRLNQIGDILMLSDYRQVNGVNLPFCIVIKIPGGTATYVFSKIITNPELKDDRFLMPDLEEVFPEAYAGLPDSQILPLLKDFPSIHEDMNVPCRDGRFLYNLILKNNYQHGLELGTFTGYSGLWFGAAFQQTGGKLVTLEIDQKSAGQARENFKAAGLETIIDSRICDALEEIPLLPGKFDFIFIDAWKPDYKKYFDLLRSRIKPGGVMVAHNVTNYARDMQEFLAAIENDPGLKTSFNTLSGEGMSISFAAGGNKPGLKLTPAELREDYQQLRQAMESLHPRLYAFTSQEEFERQFEYVAGSLDQAMSVEGAYVNFSSLAAHIGCGHSAVWMPKNYWNNLSGKLFPLKIRIAGSSPLVSGSYLENNPIPVGASLLTINGKPLQEIFKNLKKLVSADALSDASKTFRVGTRFARLYSLCYGCPDSFSIVYQLPGEEHQRESVLSAVPTRLVPGKVSKKELSLTFNKKTDTAVMTIPHFVYYKNKESFFRFIDESFAQIAQKAAANLIIDLRGNGGGDPFCAAHLFSYLIPQSLPYFSQPYGKYSRLAEPIPRQESPFTGKLYILIDTGVFSTTGHLLGLLKYHKIGTLIGEETGATFTCNDAHRAFELKNSRLQVWIARATFASAVKDMPDDRGILPDIELYPTASDLAVGQDTALDYTLKLIQSGGRENIKKEPVKQLPSVYLNHFFLVLDTETFQAIEQSPFLRNEFAVFEKRTTTRSDSSYTGIYFYGRNTYFEFFDAAVEKTWPIGSCGIAFGVDKEGELEQIQINLEKNQKAFSSEVTRGWKDIQVPWFDMLLTDSIPINPLFISWIMAYDPRFLEEWHPDKPPAEPGISRKKVLERYAAVLNTDQADRLLQDVTGIKAAVPEKIISGMKKLGVSLGLDIVEKDDLVIIKGSDLKLQLIPETSSQHGIVQIEFSIKGKPKQVEHHFGHKSVLTFPSITKAIWKF